jgi:hypothetical protein
MRGTYFYTQNKYIVVVVIFSVAESVFVRKVGQSNEV